MSTILQIFGGIFLLILLCVVLAIFLLRRKLIELAQSEAAGAAAGVPPEITLIRLNSVEPEIRERMNLFINELRGFGFHPESMYRIKEMSGITMASMIKPDQNVYAVIYDKPGFGSWLDICGKYEDKTDLTVGNPPKGGEMDSMPGREKYFLPGQTAGDLWKKFNESITGSFVELPLGGFKEMFERSWAEEMEWRLSRDGATVEEIRRVAADMDGEYTDEMIEVTAKAFGRKTSLALKEMCLKQYLKDSAMSAIDWEKIKETVFVIHEKMSPKDTAEILTDSLDIPDEKKDRIEALANDGYGGIELAKKVMLLFAVNEYFKIIGEVDRPVKAYIFQSV